MRPGMPLVKPLATGTEWGQGESGNLSMMTGSEGVSFRFPQLFFSQHRLTTERGWGPGDEDEGGEVEEPAHDLVGEKDAAHFGVLVLALVRNRLQCSTLCMVVLTDTRRCLRWLDSGLSSSSPKRTFAFAFCNSDRRGFSRPGVIGIAGQMGCPTSTRPLNSPQLPRHARLTAAISGSLPQPTVAPTFGGRGVVFCWLRFGRCRCDSAGQFE